MEQQRKKRKRKGMVKKTRKHHTVKNEGNLYRCPKCRLLFKPSKRQPTVKCPECKKGKDVEIAEW